MANKQNKQCAFTLAEVLITLGIIGIVAAMTIPTLINTSNKSDIVAKVKKTYSILSQATLQINYECGGSALECITSATKTTDDDDASRIEVTNLYKSKLKIGKDCTDGSTGCFANEAYKLLNNTDWYNLTTTFANSQMILNDGIARRGNPEYQCATTLSVGWQSHPTPCY